MSTALSDPLASSADTWREHAVADPAVPPELVHPRTASRVASGSRRCTAVTCCASSGPSTPTPRRATPRAAGRWPTTTW